MPDPADLSPSLMRAWLHRHPSGAGPTHVHGANLGFSLAVELARVSDGRRLEALLPIPGQLARFIALPGGARFLRLEDLLLMNLDRLFPGYSDVGHCAFRVLRDSDLEVEDEAEDLVREFEHALKRRRRGQVVRLVR